MCEVVRTARPNINAASAANLRSPPAESDSEHPAFACRGKAAQHIWRVTAGRNADRGVVFVRTQPLGGQTVRRNRSTSTPRSGVELLAVSAMRDRCAVRSGRPHKLCAMCCASRAPSFQKGAFQPSLQPLGGGGGPRAAQNRCRSLRGTPAVTPASSSRGSPSILPHPGYKLRELNPCSGSICFGTPRLRLYPPRFP